MVREVSGSVVEGFELVVAGRFGQPEGLENGRLFGGESGSLGDGAVAGVVGVELDAVELGAEVAPGVTGGDLGGADQKQGEPGQLDVGDDPVGLAVVNGSELELFKVAPAPEGRKFAISEGWWVGNFGRKGP